MSFLLPLCHSRESGNPGSRRDLILYSEDYMPNITCKEEEKPKVSFFDRIGVMGRKRAPAMTQQA